MKDCPQCGERTLRTKDEELKNIQASSIGECFTLAYKRAIDAWSLCSELCNSCGYVS